MPIKLIHTLLTICTATISALTLSCSEQEPVTQQPTKIKTTKHHNTTNNKNNQKQQTISFNQHIRPILNKNCTSCHGGVNVGKDSKMPGLLSLVYDLKGVRGESKKLTIIPGNPENSELFKRITADDQDIDLMPPPSHGPRLTQNEVNTIKQWIKQGAKWDTHWAYKPPSIKTKTNNLNIDHFIQAKLKLNNLQPSKTAHPATLLRRLSFDLTGLPPTIDQLNNFETQYNLNPATTYSKAVDRLLASDAFGERWTSVWMDLARYADSEGLGADRRRDVWPYRDWLIKAFNSDMPFDQFTIKQLAGDLLEKPTHEDLIATTFHRLTQNNSEGGTDDEEFRIAALIDRVNTTWEVWQGQTFGCVQCHSHPYDTIEHDEYYKFLAFFNNDQDNDLNHHFPTLKVPNNKALYNQATTNLNNLNNTQANYINPPQIIAKKSKWLTPKNATLNSTRSKAILKKNNTHQEIHLIGNKINNTTFTLNWKPTTDTLEAIKITILPTNEKTALSHPENGSVLSTIKLNLTLQDNTTTEIPISHIIPDSSENPLNFRDSLTKNANGWGPFSKIFHPRWAVITPEKTISLTNVKHITLSMNYKKQYLAGMVLVPLRSKIEYTANPQWANWAKQAEPSLLAFQTASKNYHATEGPNIPIMKMRDPKLKRNTHVFDRGNWLEKGKRITKANTPKALPPLITSNPNNPTRLDMARWIASTENPLTARIAVNRFWQQLFGIGIVETLEDLGSSGSPPTHPQLLDYLAIRFSNEHNWSTKKILKEIVMSSTYQQTANVSKAHRAKDPDNIWLSYAPRRRLSAEAIRDMGLANSGLLTHQLYGKPTYPPIPPGVWKPFARDKWITPKVGDPQRYRRALYTYWKRSIPYPALMAFDTPTREVCSKRRLISNTPTAALTTLNDEAYAEFAKALAQRMKNDIPNNTLKANLAYGYRITTSHKPDEATISELIAAHNTALKHYQNHPEQLKAIAKSPEIGAYTIVASLLLNLDASLTK